MKRFISILLCLTVIVGLCACAAEADVIYAPENSPAASTPEPLPDPTPEPVMPSPVEFLPSGPETQQPEPADTPAPVTPALPPAPVGVGKQSYDADLPGYTVLKPVYVDASSALNYYGKVFKAEYVSDGDIATCWQEAADGNGIGEYLTMDFGRTASVSLIRFRIGYAKDDTGYYMNNRPACLRIEFSDGQCVSCLIPDENDWYTMHLSAPIEFDWVRFTIDDVYGGDEYPDTCISEIVLYTEGSGETGQTQQPAENPFAGYAEPYASYMELLTSKRWTTDFGINLEDSSRLEGKTLREFWNMSWDEYLRDYSIYYFVCDFNGDGVDELMICGDCVIGLIEDCYFFGYENSSVVYLGSVEMTPGSIYRDGEGFVMYYGITEYCAERSLRFVNGVPVVGDWVDYYSYEGLSPIDRGLEFVSYGHYLNWAGGPNLEPLKELAK